MGLPAGGEWPPKHLHDALQTVDRWEAWWSGEQDHLERAYGGARSAQQQHWDRARPSQYAGGVVGAVSRWFWGSPPAGVEKPIRYHAPLAADLAVTAGTVLVGEAPEITTDDRRQADLDSLLDDVGLRATLIEAAETAAAAGGAYMRVSRDPVSDLPITTVHPPSRVVSEHRWGRLLAATLTTTLPPLDDRSTGVWRHLERHEPGVVYHGLYHGDAARLGRPMPLVDHPHTADLADIVDADGAVATGIDLLDVVHWPWQRPTRIWTAPPAMWWGRSIFQGGVERALDALDEVWTSWMRDLRLGKARIHVPRDYLRPGKPGDGAVFDLDREVYTPVQAMPAEGMQIQAQQFAIRVAEHRETVAELTASAVRGAGLSGQTLGLGDGVAMTATEVAAKERQTLTSRGRWELYAKPAIRDLVLLVAALSGQPLPAPPRITLADSVVASGRELAEIAETLRRADAASDEVIVRGLHPDWTDAEVMEEVTRLVRGRQTMIVAPEDPGLDDTLGLDGGEAE